MRYCATGLGSLLAIVLLGTSLASADQGDGPIVIHRYRPANSMQELELDRDERMGFLLRVQEMTDEIRLTRAHRDSLERRIAEYERFKTNAFFLTLEHLRLQLMDAEARLKRLKRERLILQCYGPREMRLRRRELQPRDEMSAIY